MNVAIITARAGSKSIPDKNTCEIAGGPLIAYPIAAAREAQTIDEIFITTDGESIADIGRRAGCEIIWRPEELCGDHVEIMLDCYMAFDVEYTVRLAERLRPYRLKWIEEYLIPEDLEGHAAVRSRLPWQTLAGGEHLFTAWPFRQLIEQRALDILQPDIFWVGGLTPTREISHMANAAGVDVILHGGGMHQYGLHLSAAMPNTRWCEYFVGSPPGVALTPARRTRRDVVPEDSHIFPGDGPGFGLDVEESWLVPFFN